MTRIKICGLRRSEDAEAVSRAGADLAGVILSQGFRRSVSMETAAEIRRTLHPDIPLCGVFVNETEEYIRPFVEEGVIQDVQLHGHEKNEMIDSLHRRFPALTVMKAFQIKDAADLEEAASSHADMVLLDSGTGTGRTFDWQLIGQFPRPYFLAGGLNAENASEAVGTLHPWGVDTSSGVETDGVKDAAKIEEFGNKVRTEEEQ